MIIEHKNPDVHHLQYS